MKVCPNSSACSPNSVVMVLFAVAGELFKAYLSRKEASEFVLQAIVKLLRREPINDVGDPEMEEAIGYSQQAAAAALVAAVAESNEHHGRRLAELGAIKLLFRVVSNRQHLNSQRMAKVALNAIFDADPGWESTA